MGTSVLKIYARIDEMWAVAIANSKKKGREMKLSALATAVALGTSAVSGSALADGKQAFMDANCNQCHSVTSEEITATMIGLELDGIGGRRDANSIVEYLRGGAPHPAPWTGTDEDLAAIAEWLASK